MRLGTSGQTLNLLLKNLRSARHESWTHREVILHLVTDDVLRAQLREDIGARDFFDDYIADQSEDVTETHIGRDDGGRDDSKKVHESLVNIALKQLSSYLGRRLARSIRKQLSDLYWRSICDESEEESGMDATLAPIFYKVLLPAATLLGLWIIFREFRKQTPPPERAVPSPTMKSGPARAPTLATTLRPWTIEVAVRGTQLPDDISLEYNTSLSTNEIVALSRTASYRQCVPRRPPLEVDGSAEVDRRSDLLVLVTIEFDSIRWDDSVLINEWARYLQEEGIRGTVVRAVSIDSPMVLSRAGFYET